jgi:hypothetical protein
MFCAGLASADWAKLRGGFTRPLAAAIPAPTSSSFLTKYNVRAIRSAMKVCSPLSPHYFTNS